MSELTPQELGALKLAQSWADKREYQASFILIEGLWRKHRDHSKIFFAFLELYEELDPLRAFSFASDIISCDEKWQDIYCALNNAERAYLFEKYGLMALRLKDEITATESLQRAASLGRDSLLLWATLSYLLAINKDLGLSLKALYRALELYREPSLFEESLSFLKKTESHRAINEELFLNICLALMPQLGIKDAAKLHALIRGVFPERSWLKELQEIVAQEEQNSPIGMSGETYASPDKENR